MLRIIRAIQWVSGVLLLLFAAGFALQIKPLLDLWAWSSDYSGLSPLSAVFLASIAAASALPILWLTFAREQRAAEAGALNLAVTFSASAVFAFQSYRLNSNPRVLNTAIFFIALALFNIFIYGYSRRFPPLDQRLTPLPVRVSFGVFAIVLVLTGAALILKTPNIFPWTLSVEMSVIYGWIFLGAALYFLHGLIWARWYNAAGQLLGFLAYDVVLIVPFLLHFQAVRAEQRLSLIVYVLVLLFSGALAVYYLFIHAPTRLLAVK